MAGQVLAIREQDSSIHLLHSLQVLYIVLRQE